MGPVTCRSCQQRYYDEPMCGWQLHTVVRHLYTEPQIDHPRVMYKLFLCVCFDFAGTVRMEFASQLGNSGIKSTYVYSENFSVLSVS